MKPFSLLDRGVYCAPHFGPHGELEIYAVRTNHCRVPEVDGGVLYILPGENPDDANEQLWELLDRIDPQPQTRRQSA